MSHATTHTEKSAPRPRGRPRLAPGAGRVARINWPTTPERKARVQALADAAGMTVAAWLDALADRAGA